MPTKGKKAQAAATALRKAIPRSMDLADAINIAVEAGRMSAIERYAGYLSTKQIEEEIAICAERVPGFVAAYQQELDNK